METALNLTLDRQKLVNQPQAGVAALRQQLQQLNAWPEAGDEFLALMPLSRWHSPPLTKDDNQWLPMVVKDSIKGIDIGSRYPAFFQKLLTNSVLRRRFLDSVKGRINALR